MMRCALGALAAWALMVAPVAAQQTERDCRCVDADGSEIERCTCFRSPDFDFQDLLAGVGVLPGQPRLGISIDFEQSARRDAEGALVTDVLEDGPAEAAGIRAGDVITSVDGRSLTSSLGAEAERSFDLDESVPVQRLLAITRELEPGEAVEVEYLRDGERRTTTVEVEDLSGRVGALSPGIALPRWNADDLRGGLRGLMDDREWRANPDADHVFRYRLRDGAPAPDVRAFGPRVEMLIGGLGHGGLRLAEVNPGLGEYFGTDDGVLVLDVERGEGFGLEPGDVILRIGDRSVTTPERVRRILGSYGPDEDIDFHIVRDGEERVVTGRLRY